MIPCLQTTNLDLFSVTADQRLLLGEELFSKTHFPVQLHQYRDHQLARVWSEDSVLHELLEQNKIWGNRIWALYGAAGSGKSELLRWLQLSLHQEQKHKPVLRISRTELDPVQIVHKLLHLTGKELNPQILNQWSILRNKPVTLSNSLIWNALSRIMDDDEQIIPITYKLRPLIEKNLRTGIPLGGDEDHRGRFELISTEELAEVLSVYAIPLDLDYEHLRNCLLAEFDAQVLGGYNLIKVFREVGEVVQQNTGLRPVLLIDDLVQSINVYASEFMDFCITFEEGNWDILMGLTPAAFEGTSRGKELLTRISYLDTFDDRLQKLWLTDESGNQSYFLNRENAVDYLQLYLSVYKKMNYWECGTQCPHSEKCKTLHWGNVGDITLTPFNRPLIQRMYDSLSLGKGRPRRLITLAGEYIRSLIDQRGADFLSLNVKRERSVDYNAVEGKTFIESYMPLKDMKKLKIPQDFFQLFDLAEVHKVTVKTMSLHYANRIDSPQPNKAQIIRPDLAAVRDWLEGKTVNKELLKNFRSTLYRFLRECKALPVMTSPKSARTSGVVTYSSTIEGCRVPIVLEGVDQFSGIELYRRIGSAALELISVLNSQSPEVVKLNHLLELSALQTFLTSANRFSRQVQDEFEQALQVSCEELAFLLYVFLQHVQSGDSDLEILRTYLRRSAREMGLLHHHVDLTDSEIDFIEKYFLDWFLLRQNFYNGYRLQHWMDSYQSVTLVLHKLSSLQIESLSNVYKVNGIEVKELLKAILQAVRQYLNPSTTQNADHFLQACINSILPTDQLALLQGRIRFMIALGLIDHNTR